jgi:hypothetical protein
MQFLYKSRKESFFSTKKNTTKKLETISNKLVKLKRKYKLNEKCHVIFFLLLAIHRGQLSLFDRFAIFNRLWSNTYTRIFHVK